jgi:hypothetical protein
MDKITGKVEGLLRQQDRTSTLIEDGIRRILAESRSLPEARRNVGAFLDGVAKARAGGAQ